MPTGENRKSFCGMAFDGYFFYLTIPQERGIYKFNKDFTLVCTITTERSFVYICYDSSEHCFWASVDKNASVIFKLDCCFKEIDCLRLNEETKVTRITGLSHNCARNTLLVSFESAIAEVDKGNGHTRILREIYKGCFLGALSIAPYYAVVFRDGKTQEIVVYPADGCLIKRIYLPDEYRVVDILLYPCGGKCLSSPEIMILATNSCGSACVLRCVLDVCDINLYRCNFDICRACLKEGCCDKQECFDKEDCCDKDVCRDKDVCCGNEICCACRDKDCRDCECCVEQNICRLIESVALEEAGLAHILNAEGEKQQKAVQLSCSVSELLRVNKSVIRTINSVIQLEQILLGKLQAAIDLRDPPCRETPCQENKYCQKDKYCMSDRYCIADK